MFLMAIDCSLQKLIDSLSLTLRYILFFIRDSPNHYREHVTRSSNNFYRFGRKVANNLYQLKAL